MGDPHSGFIIAAYAVAAGTIAAMIGSVVVDFRRLSAQLDLATRALERHKWRRAPMRFRLKPAPHLPDTGRVIIDSAGVMKRGTRRTPKGWWLYIPEKENV
jgi:hypothetical protein